MRKNFTLPARKTETPNVAFSDIVIHYRTLQAFVVRPFGVKNGVDFERVFYELGVRHALRDRCTFLLHAAIDEVRS